MPVCFFMRLLCEISVQQTAPENGTHASWGGGVRGPCRGREDKRLWKGSDSMKWNKLMAWVLSWTAAVLFVCAPTAGSWYATQKSVEEVTRHAAAREKQSAAEEFQAPARRAAAVPAADGAEPAVSAEADDGGIQEERYWRGELASVVLKSREVWVAGVWNTGTGKTVPLHELLNFSNRMETDEYLRTSFVTLIREEPDRYYSNAEDLVGELLGQTGYFITADGGGLTLFFNAGILGPEQEGVTEVSITYQGNPELFRYDLQTGEKK